MNSFIEKDLEDFAEANIDALSLYMTLSDKAEVSMLGRQVPCAFGRIDMLAFYMHTIFVIEFKAVKAGEKELGQVMRYCSCVERTINPAEHMSFETYNAVFDYLIYDVRPIIVAPSFSESLLASNCTLITAAQSCDGFEFSSPWKRGTSKIVAKGNERLLEALQPASRFIAGLAIGDRVRNGFNAIVGE